jgi:hypothetical protein
VGGICVLARCLIEVRNASAYLLESNISKDEAHLRLHLVGLNQSVDMQRVNKGLETSRTDFWTEHSITYSREELAKNPNFVALDTDGSVWPAQCSATGDSSAMSQAPSTHNGTLAPLAYAAVIVKPLPESP